MIKKKIKLEKLEFYIAHTCNYNCVGCNRFNNYNFKGFQTWDEYVSIHQSWAEKIDLGHYAILGGEPLMNPDIIKWIKGLKALWPNSRSKITTNGSVHKRFDKEFYNALLETNTELYIGLHNNNRRKEILDLLNQFLVRPLKQEQHPKTLKELPNFEKNWRNSYNKIRAELWPDCDDIDQWESLPEYIKKECEDFYNFSPQMLAQERLGYRIVDANGVTVLVDLENFFHQGALIRQEEKNSFTLHNSDPVKAHNICHSKHCYHMMHGKISKCGQSVLFKEFAKQFEIDLSDDDRKLIMNYEACSVDDDIESFVNNLHNPIPLCKFCPEEYKMKEIQSSIAKDKFGKRIALKLHQTI